MRSHLVGVQEKVVLSHSNAYINHTTLVKNNNNNVLNANQVNQRTDLNRLGDPDVLL